MQSFHLDKIKALHLGFLIALSVIVFRLLFFPFGAHGLGDWPSFSNAWLKDYISWPYAWSWTGLGPEGPTLYSLYRFPVWFVQALIVAAGGSSGVAMLFTYYIPITVIAPVGMYLLMQALFSDRNASFFASAAFVLNNTLVWRLAIAQPTFAMVIALAPVISFLFVMGLKSRNWPPIVFSSIVTAVSITYDLRTTYFSVMLAVALGLASVLRGTNDRVTNLRHFLKATLIYLLVLALTQSYYLIPIFYSGGLNIPVPSNYLTPNALEGLSFSSILQTLIGSHFGWGLAVGPDLPLVVLTLIAYGAILTPRSKLLKLVLVMLAIGFAFLAKGSQVPFGRANIFLFLNFPFLNAFREPLVYQMPELVAFSALFGISIAWGIRVLGRARRGLVRGLRIVLTVVVILLLSWSVIPALSLSGGYGTSYLQSVDPPQGFSQMQQWLLDQPAGRVLLVPYTPQFVYTNSQHVGVAPQSIPFWGTIIENLLTQNKTASLSKLLGLYDIRYIVVNPASDPSWQYYQTRDNYLQALNHTEGLTAVELGTSYAVFVNNDTIDQIRTVTNLGLVVGNKMTLFDAIAKADLSSWTFLPVGEGVNWEVVNASQAIIYDPSYNSTDLALSLLSGEFSIKSFEGVELQDYTNPPTGSWMSGVDLPASLSASIYSGNLIATQQNLEPSSLYFNEVVNQSGSYDVWIMASRMPGAGWVSLNVDLRSLPQINLNSSLADMRWTKLGTANLTAGKNAFVITASGGQVFASSVILVPHHILTAAILRLGTLTEGKSYQFPEGLPVGQTSIDTVIDYRMVNPSQYAVQGNATTNEYVILSQPFDASWQLESSENDASSIPAYGFLNGFLWSDGSKAVTLYYNPETVQYWSILFSLMSTIAVTTTAIIVCIRHYLSEKVRRGKEIGTMYLTTRVNEDRRPRS